MKRPTASRILDANESTELLIYIELNGRQQMDGFSLFFDEQFKFCSLNNV